MAGLEATWGDRSVAIGGECDQGETAVDAEVAVTAMVRRVGTAVVAGLGLLLASCGGGSDANPEPPSPTDGGTLRLATTNLGLSNGFDPTGEYSSLAFGLSTNLTTRTLVGYRHAEGAQGIEVVADLAESVPEPSSDGLTYSFTLKQGIKFGPPVNREITSRDVAYAFERIANLGLGAQYGFYYDDTIAGMAAFSRGTARRISGIQTPDEKTITFKLTRPAGDFLNRLALPAAGPIPREVGRCFGKPGEYGRYLVATGPYMIEGSEQQGSTCAALKPLPGFDPAKGITFVRNPSYDVETDSEARSSFVDRIELTVNPDAADIFAKIESGQLDGSPDTPPADVVARYAADPVLKQRLHVNPSGRIWFITMNLARPPFDDIHVRKAVNHIIDKGAILQAWGGETAGAVATHIVPDVIYGGKFPSGYDPYPLDEEKAKAEMRLSKYDEDKDGRCDVDVCTGLLHITRDIAPWTAFTPTVEAGLAKLGIQVTTRALSTDAAYREIEAAGKLVPIASNASVGRDFADPSQFAVPFQGKTIFATANQNYSLVGLTEAVADQIGVRLPSERIPSVDSEIAGCQPKRGDERTECWIALDKMLMEEVVPWVPYLQANTVEISGPALVNYVFDQNSGEMAFTHAAIDPTKQR